MSGDLTEQAELASRIERALWRQGSVFRPPPEAILPGYMALSSDDWLVVSTQSCSVCAPDFDREPLVEVVAATALKIYNPGHKDAKGGNNRTFHLPVKGLPETEALACNIARRAFLPRRLLATIAPESTWVETEHLDAFKGWLANYYMRIALPGELVARLRGPGGICAIMTDVLKGTSNAAEVHGGQEFAHDTPLHQAVSSIHIRINTYEELPAEKSYAISLVVVCDTESAARAIDKALADSLLTTLFYNAVVLEELIVQAPDNVTLADLGGHSRFNEWDDLSSLSTRLQSMRGLDA